MPIPLRHLVPVLAVATLAAATFRGPPAITVRAVEGTPPTPGAVLDVRTRHHTDHGRPEVTGRAIALRDGQRITRTLALTPAATEGRYGVARQWDAGTPWVLVFTIRQGTDAWSSAESMVKVDARGAVVEVTEPKGENAEGDHFPRVFTAAEIDAAVRWLGATR